MSKLSKYAKQTISKRKEQWASEKFVGEGLAAGAALTSAAAGAAIDKRFGDPVIGVLRIPGPVPIPVNGIVGGLGIASAIIWPEYPGREPISGAAVGLACETITLFTHRNVRRPDETQQ